MSGNCSISTKCVLIVESSQRYFVFMNIWNTFYSYERLNLTVCVLFTVPPCCALRVLFLLLKLMKYIYEIYPLNGQQVIALM